MLDSFIKLLGPKGVAAGIETLNAANQATFATSDRSNCIVSPENVSQVQACMRLANHRKLKIYPVSAGKNWGNGSRVPTINDCILLDLHKLNQIVDFSEDLGYVTVQAGVTQLQLFEFLNAQKSKLMINLTGSSRHSSVVANVLERGDGFGSYADRSRHVCNFEVVLPNGELFQTGFGRFPNASCAPLSSAGLGPSFDGLFLQSNLGIITQMTLWLEAKPEFAYKVFIASNSAHRFPSLINRLRSLQLRNLTPYVTWWNEYKIRARMPNSQSELPPWLGAATIFAHTEKQAQTLVEITRQALSPFSEIHCEIFEISHTYDSENIVMAYAKKSSPIPNDLDPDRDRCGLIWAMVLLPYFGRDVATAISTVETSCAAYDFEPNITLIGTDARALRLLLALVYDREVAGEDERAHACHDSVLENLMKLGYFPYRLGLQSMWAMGENDLLKQVKKLLDPNDVLAPGRYSPA